MKIQDLPNDMAWNIALPDTGWRCSICYEVAQVKTSGEIMCVKHAKEWNHGYDKSFLEMQEELK